MTQLESTGPITLQNNAVRFTYDPSSGYFDLHHLSPNGASGRGWLAGAVANALVYRGDAPHYLTTPGLTLLGSARERADTCCGPAEVLVLSYTPDDAGLALALTVALPDTGRHPACLLLRLSLSRQPDGAPNGSVGSDKSVKSDIAVHSLSPLALAGGRSSLNLAGAGGAPDGRPLTFFKHGWQSWSFTGLLGAGDRDFVTHLGPATRPAQTNPSTPVGRKPGHFWSEGFGVLAHPPDGLALIAGFVSLADQVTLVEADLHSPRLRLLSQPEGLLLEPGQTMHSELCYVEFLQLPVPDPLAGYAEAAANRMRARVPAAGDAPTGWCSWYYYGNKVTEADVQTNLDALTAVRERAPVSYVQLDDGWEEAVGDWQPNAKFPSGLRALAGSIRAAGFRPGLWLAPFVVQPDSRLMAERPEWLLRDHLGRAVNAGFIFNRFCSALDVTHPGVERWLAELIETAVKDWGYELLKLDFLYAAALPGLRHDPSRTRIQALRSGLEIIRRAAGEETLLLGCGCPLGPAIGLVDMMRVGPDVAPQWEPRVYGLSLPFRGELVLPSTRNALRSVLARSSLHRRWWWNDPDCLLVRRQQSRLTDSEIQSLASTIGLSSGTLLLSDDLAHLEPERYRWITALLPVLGERAVAADLLEREMSQTYVVHLERAWDYWTVAGVFNWSDRPVARYLDLAELGLDPDRPYHAFEFWSRQYRRPEAGRLELGTLPAHGCAVVALRPDTGGPQFVGSTFHLSAGGEVVEWQAGEHHLRAVIDLGRQAEGEIWLALPAAPISSLVAGEAAFLQPAGPGLWILPLALDGRAPVEIQVTW